MTAHALATTFKTESEFSTNAFHPLHLDMAPVGSGIVSKKKIQGTVQNSWRGHRLQFLHNFINGKFLEGSKADILLRFIMVK